MTSPSLRISLNILLQISNNLPPANRHNDYLFNLERLNQPRVNSNANSVQQLYIQHSSFESYPSQHWNEQYHPQAHVFSDNEATVEAETQQMEENVWHTAYESDANAWNSGYRHDDDLRALPQPPPPVPQPPLLRQEKTKEQTEAPKDLAGLIGEPISLPALASRPLITSTEAT